MKKILFAILLISIISLVGCQPQAAPAERPEPTPAPAAPADPEPEEEVETELEEAEEAPEEVVKNIPEEIQALFDKAKEKTQSLHYSYRGPETNDDVYEYFIKGNLVRIILGDEFKDVHLDEDGFNAVYMDTALEKSDGYCDAQECIVKGKKRPLSYNEYRFNTPLDWIDEITEAEKVGEELIDKRKAWRLDTNVGTVYIDSFSGIIQRVMDGEDEYEFIRVSVNGVKDEEVRPE